MRQILFGEAVTGFLIGACLARPVFGAVAIAYRDVSLAATVAAAVLGTGLVATLLGALPIGTPVKPATNLRIDPFPAADRSLLVRTAMAETEQQRVPLHQGTARNRSASFLATSTAFGVRPSWRSSPRTCWTRCRSRGRSFSKPILNKDGTVRVPAANVVLIETSQKPLPKKGTKADREVDAYVRAITSAFLWAR